MEVVRALEAGNQALKEMHEEMPLERIEDIIGEAEEEREAENEINEYLMGKWDVTMDGEVERELRELEEMMGIGGEIEGIQNGNDQVPLPQVPTHTPTSNHNTQGEESKVEEEPKQEERKEPELIPG